MKLESSALSVFMDFEDADYSIRVFDLADTFSEEFQTDVMDYAKAVARRDTKKQEGIFADIVQDIGGAMATADIFGRAGVLEFAYKHGYQAGAPPRPPGGNAVLPSGDRDGRIRINDRIAKLPFLEAIENLVTRKAKVLAPLAETDPQYGLPRWKRVANMYATEHAFAMARSTTQEVTDRVQDEIARAMKNGVDVNTLSERVRVVGEGMKDWSFSYACFLPGTLIEGDVKLATRSKYSGPAIEIETDDGRRLRVTINHPVLTPGGWKYAGMIQENEYLVCYGLPVKSLDASSHFPNDVKSIPDGVAIDDQNIPARVEDIFESFLRESLSGFDIERPVGALDFYGDGRFMNGNVRCVGSDRVLPVALDFESVQILKQIKFMQRMILASYLSSGACRLKNFGRQGSFASKYGGAGFCHPPFYEVHPISRSQSRNKRLGSFGSASDMDSCTPKSCTKSVGFDVELCGKLMKRFPGLVTLHRVAKVKRIAWTGHIYDLQTTNGLIVSQGIVTSNTTVVRTNLKTAYTAGSFAQLRTKGVRKVIKAFELVGIHDRSERPNHAAAVGLVASTDWDGWSKWSPPLGYN